MLPDRVALTNLSSQLDLIQYTLRNATRRRQATLSSLTAFFYDSVALEKSVMDTGDATVYEVEVVEPEEQNPHLLAYGVTRVYPGQVGDEYYMTKGHFHVERSCAEVYLALEGQGGLLQMTREGKSHFKQMRPGDVVYVPGDAAHRLVNTGSRTFVTWAVYPIVAGHDYAFIEERGFSSLVIAGTSGPCVIPNPRWS